MTCEILFESSFVRHYVVWKDTKGVIRGRKSKMVDRQYYGKKKMVKRTNIDLQSTTQKTKE
jgi:hypothetical protein